MSAYRTSAAVAVDPVVRPSLCARLWRRVQRVWLRRLVAMRGRWRERLRRCGCGRIYAKDDMLCTTCWWRWAQGVRRALKPEVPYPLPEIPNLVVPVRVPDGETEARLV